MLSGSAASKRSLFEVNARRGLKTVSYPLQMHCRDLLEEFWVLREGKGEFTFKSTQLSSCLRYLVGTVPTPTYSWNKNKRHLSDGHLGGASTSTM